MKKVIACLLAAFLSVSGLYARQYVRLYYTTDSSLKYKYQETDDFVEALKNIISAGFRIVDFSIDYTGDRKQMIVVYEDAPVTQTRDEE